MIKISNSTDLINSKIAIMKAVNEKINSGKIKRNLSMVNDLMDSILNIFNQLGGYREMVETIENTLSTKLSDIELTIKSKIKLVLKEKLFCSIEPIITSDLTQTGVSFGVKQIDPTSVLTIDPTSDNGSFVYFDNNSGIESTDFNVYLYQVIKLSIDDINYTGNTWYALNEDGTRNLEKPLLNISFKESVGLESNVITIKIDESYLGEKLSLFISNYIDSVKLFNNIQILSKIFDEILGTKILTLNKTAEQIANEKMIETICDKIFNNLNDDDIIDDSFYEFSNETYDEILQQSERKSKGFFEYTTDDTENVSVDTNYVMGLLSGGLNNSLLISQQTKILTNAISDITETLNKRGIIKDEYKFSFQTDFIKKIIKKLMVTITSYIFSPKILYLFVMLSKILNYTINTTNTVELMKEFKNLIKDIVIEIRGLIIKELTKKIIEMVTPLITSITIELMKEKMAMYKKQYDSIKNAIETAVDIGTNLVETINTVQEQTETITEKAEQITNKVV